MSNFPIYDNLYKECKNKELTVKQKNEFISKIVNIDCEGAELIYALIRHYELNNDNLATYKLPYTGKYINNEIVFDLDDLPYKLKQILYKFLNMYINKMNEDKLRI